MVKIVNMTQRQKKVASGISAIIVVYVLFGLIGAPVIIESILENQVAEAINRQVTVRAVWFNPFALTVTLKDLNVRESDGAAFVDLTEAYANLQTSSLFKRALVLKSVSLVNPDITLVRTAETTFNFSDIGRSDTAETPPKQEPAEPGGLALTIYDTRITDGRISMDDRVVSVKHQIETLNLSVNDFSSRPADVEIPTVFSLSARINGAACALDGRTQPFSPGRETKAAIGLKSLQVPYYLPYVPLPDNLVVRTLEVETQTEIDFHVKADGQPELVAAGLLSFHNVQLADGQGNPFVNHKNLKFELLPSTLLSGQIRLAQVDLSNPEFFLQRLSTGELYLPFLTVKAYDAGQKAAARDTSGQFQPVVTIDALKLNQGVIHFTDRSTSDPFSTTITDLDLDIHNFGLNNDRTATYRAALKTEADESVTLSGNASLDPLRVSGDIDVAAAKVSRYLPYYKDRFGFNAVDGQVSLRGTYRFHQGGDTPSISLAGVTIDVEKVNVVDQDDNQPLIAVDRLQVAETTADLDRREVNLGRLTLSDARLVCRREKDGKLNLVEAFVPSTKKPSAEAGNADAVDEKLPRPTEPKQEPFVVNLKRLDISGVSVDVEDRVPQKPVKLRLDEIALTAADLSTPSDKTGKADLSLRWEQEGRIQVGGKVSIEPLALDMAVKLNNIDVRPIQPYISEQVDLLVTKGFFNTHGRLTLAQKSGEAASIAYTGQAGLDRFASIDRKNADDFLNWKALLIDDLKVGVNPLHVSVDQVSLADFFARVIVDADGSVNLVSMFAKPTQPPPSTSDQAVRAGATAPKTAQPKGEAERPPIRIARVNLSGGTVDFSDRFVKPNFNAKFHDLGGRVSGLESLAEKRADVELEGMWANHAPVDITGQINPLIENPYVDLNLSISDIELSPFSPYSGKYLGHIIQKGKLTFNVAYLMEDQNLEGKNSIILNQFTLGERVDSPNAVSLPIKLAVALLKDRNGNIELDLPVSGNIDDPQFKIGKVILTVLKNLIVKIVTSPFAVLGAMAGGGEELSYLEFDAGVSEISAENAQKMDKLVTILYERPGLNLDVQGFADAETDGEALQAILLENRLKTEKLQRMLKAGKSAVPLEEITLEDDERLDILEAVFEASGIAVPLDDNKKPVQLTPELMETLLRTNTPVTDNDYRKLANTRAFNAKNYLLENGQVERERIFIVEPRAKGEEKGQEAAGEGQVVFSLK